MSFIKSFELGFIYYYFYFRNEQLIYVSDSLQNVRHTPYCLSMATTQATALLLLASTLK